MTETSVTSKEIEAKIRYARYYAAILYAANQLYQKGNEDVVKGLAWLDLEWDNICQGQRWVSSLAIENTSAADLCSRYPDAGVYCLELRQHPQERIQWLNDALKAAQLTHDRHSETACLGNLGLAYAVIAQYEQAIEFHNRSLEIDTELHLENGVANDWNNLGIIYQNLGEYEQAEQYYNQALSFFEKNADQKGQACSLLNLGNLKNQQGQFDQAPGFYRDCFICWKKRVIYFWRLEH